MPSFILPGPGNPVVIDYVSPGTPLTINYSSNATDVISSLTVTLQSVVLNLTAGTLDLSGTAPRGTLEVDQPGDGVILSGGTLANADVTAGTTIYASNAGGTLNAVQLDGTLDMTTQNVYNYPSVTVTNGLVLNGTILLGGASNYAYLDFGTYNEVAQTVSGTGNIQFGIGTYSAYLYNYSYATLTIGPHITIEGGTSSYITGDYGPESFDFQGTIIQYTVGGQLTINGIGWVNDGQMTVTDSMLNLTGSWTNSATGTITADPSTISLGGQYATQPSPNDYYYDGWTNKGTLSIAPGSTVNLGGILTTDILTNLETYLSQNGQALSGDTVNLIGTLDNSAANNPMTGGMLDLTFPLGFQGGYIYQGTVTGDDLVGNPNGGTLDGVTLDNTFDLGNNAYAYVTDNLTLNGTINLGGPTGGNAALYFNQYSGENLLGTGDVIFGQGASTNYLEFYSYDYGSIFNIAQGITIEGGSSSEMDVYYYAAVVNQGKIVESTANGTLSIANGALLNQASQTRAPWRSTAEPPFPSSTTTAIIPKTTFKPPGPPLSTAAST